MNLFAKGVSTISRHNRNCVPGSRNFFLLAGTLVLFLLGSASLSNADQAFIERFFPTPPSQRQPNLRLPERRRYSQPPQVDHTSHNNGVRANNQGVEAMQSGNTTQAISFFEQAVAFNPGETTFLSNLLSALRKEGRNIHRATEIAHMLIDLDPQNTRAPHTLGSFFFEVLKQPESALPYLALAHQINPKDPDIAISLALVLEKAGYPAQALQLLEKFAPESTGNPYPIYITGVLLINEKRYDDAVATLEKGLRLDTEGFVHDAYIRARFFSGKINGLANTIKNAVSRFPRITNRDSLERILFAVEPRVFELEETISVEIAHPDDVKQLDFSILPPPDLHGHQQVSLLTAEFEAQRARKVVDPARPDEEGRIKFTCPMDMVKNRLTLKLTYRIKTWPLLSTALPDNSMGKPDPTELGRDPLLSLDNGRLEQLFRRISQSAPSDQMGFVKYALSAIDRGFRYFENHEDHSVAWALSSPDKTDCTEYSRLLAALCLKRGIPARMATGFLVKQEFLNIETAVGHAWIEVYLDNSGWLPIDPTLGSTMGWAYFGNILSDQILFERPTQESKSRISIDFMSTRPDMNIEISNLYKITVVQ